MIFRNSSLGLKHKLMIRIIGYGAGICNGWFSDDAWDIDSTLAKLRLKSIMYKEGLPFFKFGKALALWARDVCIVSLARYHIGLIGGFVFRFIRGHVVNMDQRRRDHSQLYAIFFLV